MAARLGSWNVRTPLQLLLQLPYRSLNVLEALLSHCPQSILLSLSSTPEHQQCNTGCEDVGEYKEA